MSEQEQERPLTRRELRMREQATQESASPEAESSLEFDTPDADSAPSTETVPEVEIEISPLNEDGTVRTRREIRALREAAYAELQAEHTDSEESAAEDSEESDAKDEEAEEADESVEAPADSDDANDATDDAEDNAEGDVDISFGPPTEAFSIEDMLDAVQPVTPTGDVDAVAALFADEDADEDDLNEGPVALSFTDDTTTESDAAEPVEDVSDVDEAVEDDFIADDLVEADASDAEEVEEADAETETEGDDSDVAEEVVPVVADGSEDDWIPFDEEPEEQPTGYSFPDIQPPEEWRSVFDDPSRITSLKNQGGTGDFDDLISRAVAQEGSTGTTGASALILPSHPGDTGGLAGPLGATGELFVTGSIELPKSLGETGGHAALLDSVETNQFLTGEPTSAMDAVQDEGPVPVSALSAVSARRRPEVPVVAEPTKDKSKMPIILALSGGGLLIVIAGAVILAATQGWFA